MPDQRLSFPKSLAIAIPLAACLSSASASAADASSEPKLALFAATGWLASPGANGAAIEAGLRVGVARHVALSFDVGYGVLAATSGPTIEDRWWILPALAYVRSAGRVRVEPGGAFGLGASSGYVSWPAYLAKPFAPTWAYQLMPTARVHAAAALAVSPKVDVFARVETAKLLASGSDHSMRDTTWATLSIGANVGVL